MKKFIISSFFWISILLPILSFAAPSTIDFTRESGEIQGTLDYCGQSGSEGIEVSIPGKSFIARTDFQGQFTLSYVPEGIWSLVFNKKGQRLGSLSGVEVLRRSLTDLDVINGPILLCSDLDGDGYTPDQDCNDANIRVFPGAPELCGNGLDDNCTGGIDENCPECNDYDNDGFYAQVGCGFVDCDDANTLINPGAPETCGDGLDNDCDGQVDEADANDAVIYYQDFDGDGYGTDFTTQTACNPPEGYVAIGGDCDDASYVINPGRLELCNGIDDNCDELIDNDCSNQVCSDQDVADFEVCVTDCTFDGNDLAECFNTCVEVVSSQCASALVSLAACSLNSGCFEGLADELCVYDNCPGQWEAVFGNYIPPDECVDGETRACDGGGCNLGIETCSNGRWPGTCTGVIYPDIYYPDLDNDGYTGEEVYFCDEPPEGYYPQGTLPGGDCNDLLPSYNPGITSFESIPEGGGFDFNCDGVEEKQFTSLAEFDLVNCELFQAGWITTSDIIPNCGTSYPWVNELGVDIEFGCYAIEIPEIQGCR